MITFGEQHCNTNRIKRQKPYRVNDCAANATASFLTHAVFAILCERVFSVVMLVSI